MHLIHTFTQDGLKLTGLLSTPEHKTDTIIIHIHGMAGSPYENDWYEDFHTQYPKLGYAFLSGQLRGTGQITDFKMKTDRFTTKGNAFEVFSESVFDIDAWVSVAREYGYTNIILSAHSFGPSKVAHYYSQERPNEVSSLIFISPVDMYGFGSQDKNYEVLFQEASEYLKEEESERILSQLFGGDIHLSARTFLDIFSLKSQANVFCYTSRSHDWSVVQSIDIPVLLIGGTKDGPMIDVCDVKESFTILSKNLTSSHRVESTIYEGAYHSFDGFGEKIVQDVVNFLKS